MTSEQKNKLAKYRAKLTHKREKRIAETMLNVIEKLHDMTEAIANKEQPTPVVNNTFDTDALVDAIKDIKINTELRPTIKVDVPQQLAPTVVVKNDDIYARYKRVNSQNDPDGTRHGFVDADGNWFIQLESSTDTGADRTRYAVGSGSFASNWTNRRRLSYLSFDKVVIV